MEVSVGKRVNLAACYFQKNYGSMLQAYALQEAVNSLGYEAENLRIDGIAKEIRNRKLGYYARQLADWSMVKEKAGMVRKVWQKKKNRNFAKLLSVRSRIGHIACHLAQRRCPACEIVGIVDIRFTRRS